MQTLNKNEAYQTLNCSHTHSTEGNLLQSLTNTVLNTPAHSEKSQSRMLRNHFFLSQIFGILELTIILSFNFTICLIFISGILFLFIVFHIPLCNVRQPYTGCPFTCNLAEITRNETVWRMRTNNVKRVYCTNKFDRLNTGVTRAVDEKCL